MPNNSRYPITIPQLKTASKIPCVLHLCSHEKILALSVLHELNETLDFPLLQNASKMSVGILSTSIHLSFCSLVKQRHSSIETNVT